MPNGVENRVVGVDFCAVRDVGVAKPNLYYMRRGQ